MDQHKLYNTIRDLSDDRAKTDEQILGHVLEKIIHNEEIPIRGGRVWKLDPSGGSYRLLRQVGDIDRIDKTFRIRVQEYPVFLQLHKRGTIVATETNRYLRRKGIRLYSATGVGEKVAWKTTFLFQYVISINADFLKQDLTYALNIIGSALTSALRNRRIESKAKQLQMDLDRARAIQQSILPGHEFRFGNYDLYGASLPDRIVGGDFFDYLEPPDDRDRLGVVIADAASKGLSAAAEALYVSGALRMGASYNTKISTLISRVNQLVNRAFSPEQFISMVYLELLSSDNGLVLYINAGHSTPILLRAGADDVERLPATGQILGPFAGEKYRAEFTLLQKGDVLFLYTDGIVEARNDAREMFGEQRLIHILRERKSSTPKEIAQYVLQEVQTFGRAPEYSDDKTLVVIKRTR
jgi:sigma-B regulation protein RsbU (phosphoserine phosphatase)